MEGGVTGGSEATGKAGPGPESGGGWVEWRKE